MQRASAVLRAQLAPCRLAGADLCQHVCFVGGTGSGKTTVLNRLLADLVAHRASERDRRTGLLVLDFKADGMTALVQALAEKAGRAEDVVVVDGVCGATLDPLSEITTLDGLSEFVEMLLALQPQHSVDNGYWEAAARKRLDHALTAHLFASDRPLNLSSFLETVFDLFSLCDESRMLPIVARLKACADRFATAGRGNLALKVRSVVDGLNEWEKLDPRTRSNETSTLTNHLHPLLSAQVPPYLARDGGAGALRMARIVEEGAIVVLRINATNNTVAASTLGRLAKAMFYRAAQARHCPEAGSDRLVGLIADEFPLVVSRGTGAFSDATQLQTLRSRRAFVVAATQGFSELDRRVGPVEREALTTGFNTWFFMNTDERAVDEFAHLSNGNAPSGNPRAA
jgi:hypothetical protein